MESNSSQNDVIDKRARLRAGETEGVEKAESRERMGQRHCVKPSSDLKIIEGIMGGK